MNSEKSEVLFLLTRRLFQIRICTIFFVAVGIRDILLLFETSGNFQHALHTV
jgi:hypothetical protein